MAIVACKHCGSDCDGRTTLAVHLCSLRVNQLALPWSFCNEDCRDAWFETPTDEHLFHVAAIPEGLPREEWTLGLHEHDGETIATVIHHDGGDDRFGISIPGAPADTIICGTPVAQHRFDHPHHINAWWCGEEQADPLPLPTEKEGS